MKTKVILFEHYSILLKDHMDGLYRLKVPNGWIVKLAYENSFFINDPDHKWEIELSSNY